MPFPMLKPQILSFPRRGGGEEVGGELYDITMRTLWLEKEYTFWKIIE